MKIFSLKMLLVMVVLAMFSAVVVAQDFLPEPPIKDLKAKPAAVKPAGKIYTNQQLLDAFEAGGNMLLATQHTDGGWKGWKVDPTVLEPLTDPSHLNQFGVNARALVLISTMVKNPPKDYIGDGTYGASLTMNYNKNMNLYYYFDPVTNKWMRSYYYSTDRVFMGEYSFYTGDQTAVNAALAEWTWVKNNVAYFQTPQAMLQWFVTNRAKAAYFNPPYYWGYGLVLWDIGGYADGCEAVGDHSYALSLLDLIISEQNWTPPPADPDWGSVAPVVPGITKSLFNNFIKRWDYGTPALANPLYFEFMFVSTAGQLLQAFQNVDPARYKPQLDALKSRLIACQITNPASPYFGAFSYGKYGWEGLQAQDNGYACMGIRRVGEVVAGQKATDFLIRTQLTSGIYSGGWTESDGFVYIETCAEALQGMWEVAQGEQKPWVNITVNPPGSHQDTVPVAFGIYDLQSNPATVKVEWTENDGVVWTPTTQLVGATTGLSTSPVGQNHSLVWLSFSGDKILKNFNAKLKITARDDDTPDAWGFPAGVTDTFSVNNETIPVELSVFSLE